MNTHHQEERIDGQLRTFFRSETPDPWPDFQYPTSPRSAAAGSSRPMMSWARCIVAVCLALFFGLYLSLASYFRPSDGPTVTPNEGMIGTRPNAHKGPNKSLDVVPMPMKK